MKDLLDKLLLAIRIWLTYLLVSILLWRLPLHKVVAALGRRRTARSLGTPARYSTAIHRILRVGQYRPRCLPSALVLFRLLKLDGTKAELVIGLPSSPESHIAHAWVEIDGRDVGPPPGRHQHEELARYR